MEFHSAIGDCAHNIVLLHTLRSCYRLLEDDVFYNRQLIYNQEGMREKLLRQHMAKNLLIFFKVFWVCTREEVQYCLRDGPVAGWVHMQVVDGKAWPIGAARHGIEINYS